MSDAGKPAAAPDRATFPLGWKLALLATALATIPLAGVGVALVSVNRDAVENLSREVQLAVLDDLARTIDQELGGAQDALESAGALFADSTLDDERRIALLTARVQGDEAIDHVALYDAAGARLAVIESEGRSFHVPDTLPRGVRDEIERLHAWTGEVDADEEGPRVLIAQRIRVRGRTTGYVLTRVSLQDVQARVERLAEGHFPGLPDALFVVDARPRTIAHVDPERAAALTSAANEGILAGVTPDMLGPTFSQSGEYASADGTAMLASTAGLRTVPWGLVAQVPQDVAYASITRMTYIVAGTVAGAMLLALALGLLVARRISAPLAELTRFSGALSRREFDDRAKVHTRDELAVLGRAMNGAAADLKASEARIREEVAIRTDLGRYIPGELVDQIVRRERDMALGGTRRPITVLFADVVGFTPLTDKLEPEQVVAILNELFTILTQIVFRHRGMVDKFVGDCVMAVWGAPSAQDDHATRAVTAADEMLSWLETGNERWREKYGVTIQLAIGVNTGEAVVGNVGSEKRMEYTAIGDVVNVAARLESIARPQQILVTEAVKEAVGDAFEFDDADLHRLSGRPQPVHLYAVRT